jgi:GH15 family glucan-1,4-alpha-glucosidase
LSRGAPSRHPESGNERSGVTDDRYPAIGDYAFIADCHSAALISRGGSIDWCCMPRIDSESLFGRLLDRARGGYFQIAPRERFRVRRRYLDATLVLETTFATDGGEARLLDCFVMREGGRERPARQVIRLVEGVHGRLELGVRVVPRFDYGAIRPWIRPYGERAFALIGGDDGVVLSGDVKLFLEDRYELAGTIAVEEGARARISMQFAPPEDLDGDPEPVPEATELDDRLEETVRWWRRWADQGDHPEARDADAVLRSSLVLKGLTQARTGAIAAAATTSLPEVPGGDRNWDYRFSWIRDSTWAVRSLYELDHHREADGFRRFVERSAAGHVDDLQIVYGMGGERRLPELELDLEGYRGARPVRIGNAAAHQRQHDVYGELLELAWRWHREGHSPDDHYWKFLAELVDAAAQRWGDPDRGIWEVRHDPQHFVHSKVMSWAAVDRGLALAEETGRAAPIERWKRVREEIRKAVESDGYDPDRGVFVRAFGSSEMDGALLLVPGVRFVEWDDPRMVRTADAIREELDADGLLYRYTSDEDEGAFLPCSFWLAECLARQGRTDAAREVFDRAREAANDVGLFSEEFDPRSGEMLGNFPQALTHLSHISAALALEGKGDRLD